MVSLGSSQPFESRELFPMIWVPAFMFKAGMQVIVCDNLAQDGPDGCFCLRYAVPISLRGFS